MWGKGQQDVLFFLTWKCTDAGREEYLQFIWKDNEHLLRCYLWTWRNKVVLWQIFIIILCSLPDTGWFGGFFQFKHSKHFLFLCVMHIGKYSCFTCSLEFKIHEEKDIYFRVRWGQISQGCDALRCAADEYILYFLWICGED